MNKWVTICSDYWSSNYRSCVTMVNQSNYWWHEW